jgi:hypothetical protein
MADDREALIVQMVLIHKNFQIVGNLSDGTIRTDLQTLSDDDLASLGWLPAPMPPTPGTSYYTHSYEWNSETVSFDATELDEFEKKKS